MALIMTGTQKVGLASFLWPSPTYSWCMWTKGRTAADDLSFFDQAACCQSYFVGVNWMMDLQNADASGVFKVDGTGLSTTAWTHWAVTHDTTSPATLPKMYINGVQQTVTLNSGGGTQFTPAASALSVGNGSSGGFPFGKAIEWFSVYNIVLSSAEINQAYLRGMTQRGMELCYPMILSSDIADMTGHMRNGTLTGSPAEAVGAFDAYPLWFTLLSGGEQGNAGVTGAGDPVLPRIQSVTRPAIRWG